MLTIKPLSSAGGSAGGIRKYLEGGVVKSDTIEYYGNKDGSATSMWMGTGAEILGLTGAVDGRKVEELLEGKIDGQELKAEGKKRRMGSDLTFSAPKSVSIVALGLDDDRVIKAHDEAVKEAMQYIEQTVAKARYGKGGKATKDTGVLITAAYRHEDARPVDGYVSPQLHTHALVINATKDEKGWRGLDLDFGKDSVRMHTADAIYKSRLAMRLKEMGYEIRQTKDGFEIEGISDQQIADFSKRRVQIDEDLREQGLTREGSTTGERTAANLKTRSAKLKVDSADLHMQWHRDCRDQNLDSESLLKPKSKSPQNMDAILQKSITDALEHYSERQSVFSSEKLYLTAIKNGIGNIDYEKFMESIETHPDIIKKQEGLVTTVQSVERDAWIAGYAMHTQGKMDAFINTAYSAGNNESSTNNPTLNPVQERIHKLEQEQKFKFSAGQRDAITLSVSSTDKVIGIVGAAGAGKTTAMNGITKIAHESNYEVIGIAPSAAAAKQLQCADANQTETIAAFVLKENASDKPRLVIVDEAGMVSASDMKKIMEKLGDRDKLLLVGDPKQLSAVEAGSPFADLINNERIRYAEINEIQRQKDENLLSIAQDFADGNTADAVEKVSAYMHEVAPLKTGRNAKGEVVASTQDKRNAIATATADEYLKLDQDMRDKTLVLSGTNEVRSMINHQIRDKLKDEGYIDSNEVSVTALKKSDMTKSESTKAHNYSAGMLIRESYSTTNEEGFKVTMQRDWNVASCSNAENELCLISSDGETSKIIKASEMAGHSYKAYSVEQKQIAANDKLVILENNKDLGLLNGDTLTVNKVEEGKIYAKDSSGLEHVLDPSKPISMDYGYCLTIHKSQGQTVENTIVAGEASRTATAEAGYVACSREKYGLTIITDNSSMLQKRWQSYADRESAEHNKVYAIDSEKLEQSYERGMSNAYKYVNNTVEVKEIEKQKDKEPSLEKAPELQSEFSM